MTSSSLRLNKNFLSPTYCSRILHLVLSFKGRFSIPHVVHEFKERSLNYHVIDGKLIAEHLPAVAELVDIVQKEIDQFSQIPVKPLSNARVAVNVNLTSPGGGYRWHYDRNAVTALLYLNEVEGGEIEIFEDYRILLKSQHFNSFQKILDQLLLSKLSRWIFSSKYHMIQPRTGHLLLMKANRCLHSVRQVRGTKDRICVVFAFDVPGKTHPVDEGLDSYLYTEKSLTGKDPNYL